MASRARPWQYEWKRPHWQQASVSSRDATERSVKGVPIGVTSAELSPAEALALGVTYNEGLVLTISLYDFFHFQEKGDALVLELVQQTKDGSLTRLKERTLQWPSLATHNHQAVCSIALSRRPQVSTSTRTAIDALDVLARMSLGASPMMEQASDYDMTPSLEAQNSDETTALLLSCLTTDGQIYLYEPLAFLTPVVKQEEDFGTGLADLLLGGTLHQLIQDSIFPLSQPLATTSLSVSLKHYKKQQPDNLSEGFFGAWSRKKESSKEKAVVWDDAMWDANVEPSTAVYRTLENQPFQVEPIFEYFAVLGKGLKTQSSEIVHPRKVESMSTLSLDETDRADDEVNEKEKESDIVGGFITFLSMTHFTQTRTVYLPFAPKAVYPVVWGDMSFVLVIEETGTRTLAIRVDSSQHHFVPCGSIPMSRKKKRSGTDAPQMCPIPRFHLIPVLLPVEDQFSTSQTMAVSTMLSTPPSIAIMHSSRQSAAVDMAVTLHSLDSVDLADGFSKQKDMLSVVIRTKEQSGHAARIPRQVPAVALKHAWCRTGQGWSLVGVDRWIYFICWEGAMASSGAFLSQLYEFDTPVASAELHSAVLPLQSFRNIHSEFESGIYQETEEAVDRHIPFTAPFEVQTTLKARANNTANVDDIMLQALDSLSNIYNRDVDTHASPDSSHRRTCALTAKEKSRRLLQQCISWNLLDEKQDVLDGHVPVVLARLGESQQIGVLSLRNIVVSNGQATPFKQVLAWLSQEHDYFTAASIALSLLRDIDSLRDLRALGVDIDYDTDHANLEGLLDGIVPLYQNSTDMSESPLIPTQSILTQVADMTLGCLIKGGLSMSATLESFVKRDKNYNPARVCMMLVAVATRCLSGERDTVNSAMGPGYDYVAASANPTDLLWTVRALLLAGASRDFLPTVLVLLNATIGGEMRRRWQCINANESAPFLELSTALVSTIIKSSPDAPILILGLVDDASRKRFWPSLDHKTQLEYSLISVDKMSPLLRQLEVRAWALENLQDCFEKKNVGVTGEILDAVPTQWLKGLSLACLCNAGCRVDLYCFDKSATLFTPKDDDDGAKRQSSIVKASLSAMAARPELGGLDFNLLIPSLLLLENRGVQWHDDAVLSTQTMIDAACYLAGRHSKDEPLFIFDGRSLMRQCALSGNVIAGANLVGGREGLVLKCCDILTKGAGMTIYEAESFLLDDAFIGRADCASMPFVLTDEHRKTLWLFDEHVLSVRTFGEFRPVPGRGKIDPVFAARTCLRTWSRLNSPVVSTDWLVAWFRRRLGIVDGAVSHKRLACAALVRALMWPAVDNPAEEVDPDSDQLLANTLRLESIFLVQLCQACCGLVEAVPPSMAEEAIRGIDVAQKAKHRGVQPVRLNVGLH